MSTVSPETTRVGWIGTGVMGSSMCGHVLDAGYAVTVYNRTRDKAEALLEKRCDLGGHARRGGASSDVVFAHRRVPERRARAVFLGDVGVLAGASPGSVLVDMTTSEPSLAGEIYEAARGTRASPRSMRPCPAATSARATRRCRSWSAATRTAVERVRPLFEVMGKTIVRQGGPGAGQHTKMVNQILIATGMIGVCEALLYGYKAGLDLETVLEVVGGGAAGSWSLANYGPRMLAGNFDPGFFVEHFVKDMGIALAEARRMNLSLPGLALAQQLYIALVAQGGGRKGTHSLVLALASLSDVEWQPTTGS